jgi:hypothetical protein
MATSAAYTTWRRVYQDPADIQGGKFETRSDWYRTLWSYYDNSAFEDLARWSGYKKTYSLYRQTRFVYNPTRRLVDFYAGQVYPGVLSDDGAELPEGIPSAIPLADDTPIALQAAIGQLWQWSNWQAGKSVFVRYGAATGSALVEVVDDLERAKVTLANVWPGHVRDLHLDATGNVKSYTIEYTAYDDEQKREYQFAKSVDDEWFRTFRDGKPWAPDGGDSEYPNPYGFVPACWVKHRDLGGDHGAPAIHGSLGKIDELNSLASHVHDQIHKVIGAPMIIFSEGSIGNLLGRPKRGDTDELAVPEEDRESLLLLKGPQGGSVASLAGDLDLGQAMPYLESLLTEIERDYPELGMYRDLRQMTQVTGPGAQRVMGDVAANVWESAANYDQQLMKAQQMAIAIGGWRASTGAWGSSLTRQQVKFRPFNLDSYAKGDLDHTIMPRPLIPVTEAERLAGERQKVTLEADRNMLTGETAGIAARLTAAAGA